MRHEIDGLFMSLLRNGEQMFAIVKSAPVWWPASAPSGSATCRHGCREWTMKIAGAGKLLRIFLGESDRYEGVPLL